MKTTIKQNYWWRPVAGVCMGAMAILMMTGCRSDNGDSPEPGLPDVEWEKTQKTVTLNGYYLNDATVEMTNIAESDSVRLTLYGIHPKDTIEMDAAMIQGEDGKILLKGERTADDVRRLQVDGVYRPESSTSGMSEKSSVKLDLTYRVPCMTNEPGYKINFSDNGGFCHIPGGIYPNAKDDIVAQNDSCDLLCRKINVEIRKNLKYLSFRFDDNGLMTLRTETAGGTQRESFRYWVRVVEGSDKRIIEIENPGLFYGTILNAMGLPGINEDGELLYTPPYNVASICLRPYRDGEDTMVVVLDNLHFMIFPYFFDTYTSGGVWDGSEKRYIDLMEKSARVVLDTPYKMALYSKYRWALIDG